MIADSLSLSAAFMLGLLGGTHCLGMCGGIMSALTMSCRKRGARAVFFILLSYNIGRISSYMLAGLIVGLLGLWLQNLHTDIGLVLRIVSALLLVLMGLYLTGWWMALTVLETAGGKLWKMIQPLGNRLMPVHSVGQAFMLGCLWGWLPCGLVYSMLAWSAASADLTMSMAVMLAFGLGTLPAVMATGVFARQVDVILKQKGTRQLTGLLIIVFGLWTLYGSLMHMTGGDHSHHQLEPVEVKTEMKHSSGESHSHH